MPITHKADAAGFSGTNNLITADDYNRHDEELRAIEEFLGIDSTFPRLGLAKDPSRDDRAHNGDLASANDEQVLLSANGGRNLLKSISRLTDQMNVLVDGGITSSSGEVQSSQRIIFPESSQFCYLAEIPGSVDSSITVNSTAGFPNEGVLTILNDVQQAVVPGATTVTSSSNTGTRRRPVGVTQTTTSRGPLTERVSGGVTMTEWIRYNGKTGNQFLNCERGYLGTYVGPHAGAFEQVQASGTTANNLRDFCLLLSAGYNICQRRNPAWRFRTTYSFPLFSLTGTMRQITAAIRVNAGKFRVYPNFAPDSFNLAVESANSMGILRFTSRGAMYLQSTSMSAPAGQLTAAEASEFVLKCSGQSLILEINDVGSYNVYGMAIPVFAGRLGIQYSLADLTRADKATMDATQLIQTADGRVVVTITKQANRDETLQGVAAYKTFFVSSPRTTQERDQA